MSDDNRIRWHVSPQIIFGAAIVFFGLVLTAENLGIARNFTRIINFWPLVFTAAGVSMVLDRDASGSRKAFGTLLVIGGLWQTANTAFGLNFYIDEWWPLAIVAFGVFLIARAVQQRPTPGIGGGMGDGGSRGPGAPFVNPVDATAPTDAAAGPDTFRRDDVVTAFAIMSGVKRNITSPLFRRANLTAVMGGVECDLRQCTATGGESVIDVFAIWGGIQIRVPPDWQVVSEVTPIMGGVDDRSSHVQPYRHRLVIKGMAIMGGAEVKS